MKFYDCTTAPSPRRVRIFLAEKGISVPTVQVDLRNGEQFSPAFRAINPDCTVPVLELDNGTRIADIVAICRYFEELHPTPPLMGRTAEEKAVIEAWQRRIERDGFYAAMEALRNSTPGLKGRALPGSESYEQIPALAERGRARIAHFFAWLGARLDENEFVCGPQFTIADITGLVTVGRGVAWASWRESAESPRCPFCPAASDGGASGASLTAAPPAVSQRSSVSTPVAECERAVEKFNFFPLDGGRLGRGWVRQSTLAPHPDPPPRGGEGE